MAPLALGVAFACGFLSLSYEILWFRVASWESQGAAWTFGVLLGAYLAGLAYGSRFSRRFCDSTVSLGDGPTLGRMGLLALMANGAGWLVVPLAARTPFFGVLYLLVFLAAALLGSVFPIVCHVAIPPDGKAGARMSYVYIANILGSALGSLLTGFVLLDHAGLSSVCLGLALAGVGLSAAIVLPARLPKSPKRALLGSMALVTLALPACHGVAYDRIYERFLLRPMGSADARFDVLVETKSGVIAVTRDKRVYGGGAYDGAINIDLTHDTNGLYRAAALGALHPSPKKVLMIGLATGAWAEVLLHVPGVEHITAIEINPGYVDVIRRYPEVAPLLSDGRLTLEIDDGRRWLLRHPEAKFDAVVCNTTWHWRAHSTNLLSQEFQRRVGHHLNPGGIFYFNTTFSEDVQRTALDTFPHVLRVFNFMAVSNAPIQFDPTRWAAALEAPGRDGRPRIDRTTARGKEVFDRLMTLPNTLEGPPIVRGLESAESLRGRLMQAHIVTEDNMWTEWNPQTEEEFGIRRPPP